MPKIFISYRRQDNLTKTDLIYTSLKNWFGKENIFRDLNNIEPGSRFYTDIQYEIDKADVLLVFIGKEWLNLLKQRRQNSFDRDILIFEIESGLKRGHSIEIIPVLFDDTPFPEPNQLPEEVRGLTKNQFIRIRDGYDYENDIDKLIKSILDFETKKLEDQRLRNNETERRILKIRDRLKLARSYEKTKDILEDAQIQNIVLPFSINDLERLELHCDNLRNARQSYEDYGENRTTYSYLKKAIANIEKVVGDFLEIALDIELGWLDVVNEEIHECRQMTENTKLQKPQRLVRRRLRLVIISFVLVVVFSICGVIFLFSYFNGLQNFAPTEKSVVPSITNSSLKLETNTPIVPISILTTLTPESSLTPTFILPLQPISNSQNDYTGCTVVWDPSLNHYSENAKPYRRNIDTRDLEAGGTFKSLVQPPPIEMDVIGQDGPNNIFWKVRFTNKIEARGWEGVDTFQEYLILAGEVTAIGCNNFLPPPTPTPNSAIGILIFSTGHSAYVYPDVNFDRRYALPGNFYVIGKITVNDLLWYKIYWPTGGCAWVQYQLIMEFVPNSPQGDVPIVEAQECVFEPIYGQP